ncbi:MAG: hypothetical protein ABII26_04175 [Pseudomonadota bacterium]
MNTYFLMFKVKPVANNEFYGQIGGALAHLWVVDTSPKRAHLRAEHYLSGYYWEVESLEQRAIETTEAQFAQEDIGLANYKKAQKYGIALFLSGWPDNEESQPLFHPLK